MKITVTVVQADVPEDKQETFLSDFINRLSLEFPDYEVNVTYGKKLNFTYSSDADDFVKEELPKLVPGIYQDMILF